MNNNDANESVLQYMYICIPFKFSCIILRLKIYRN